MPLIEVLAEMERVGLQARHRAAGRDRRAGWPSRSTSSSARSTSSPATSSRSARRSSSATVLFDELGLTKKRRGKTGFSTDARVLAQIRDEHEIVAKVERWRELTKLKNTYLDALPDADRPENGRIHTTFNQVDRATGRLSSTNPNLQNIPIRSEVGRPVRGLLRRRARATRLLSCRLQPGRAAGARPRRRRGRAARDLRLRRGRARARPPPRIIGADPDAIRPGGALEGEDGQLRDRLRALGLRARGPAQDRARGGRHLHRALLRALPGGQGVHRRDDRRGRGARLRQHADGPPPQRSPSSARATRSAAGSASGSPSTP